MKTHYQQVKEFSDTFEVKLYEGDQEFILGSRESKKLMRFRCSLINEEVKELAKAIKDRDYIEVVDALCDILYVAYGMYIVIGINADKKLRLKLCDNKPVINRLNLVINETRIYTKIEKDIERLCFENSLVDSAHFEMWQMLKSLAVLAYNTDDLSIEDTKKYDIFTDLPFVNYRLEIIEMHRDALSEAIELGHYEDMITLLGDVVYATYDATAALGIDINKAFDIVHKSNMSKLCSSEAQAIKTVKYYKSIPETSDKYYDSPAYRESKVGGKWIIYNESTSKILKNIDYHTVDFSEIL